MKSKGCATCQTYSTIAKIGGGRDKQRAHAMDFPKSQNGSPLTRPYIKKKS